MDDARLWNFVADIWDRDILPTLSDYIRIPAKSPAFDPDWAANGHIEAAVTLLSDWAQERLARLAGASLEILRLPGKTPLILIEIPGVGDETVLLYGHLDKQPEMDGWAAGYSAWLPRLEGDKLYGRGGADDGYAMFAALAAILALHDQGIAYARCVVLIEASEESCSVDLPAYMEVLSERIGVPALVICLDSGCSDYDRLWLTTSLRGTLVGSLHAAVLTEGVHSGDASGIVPSVFRILRLLISRIENDQTGEIRVPGLHAPILAKRRAQARQVADALGEQVYAKFPFVAGAEPVREDRTELVLNRAARPQLAIVGADGLPAAAEAGNIMLPRAMLKLSFRLPPTISSSDAGVLVKRVLEENPPYGAAVQFMIDQLSTGWEATELAPWLQATLADASERFFGKPPALAGEGGGITFMGMLGARYPKAQFVVTGVLGPGSNAHGPNEFLHIPTGKRISAVIARVLTAHARQSSCGCEEQV